MAWVPASKPGDTDPLISDAKEVLDNYRYGAEVQEEEATGYTDTYTEAFGAALLAYADAVNVQVRKGQRDYPLVTTTGAFDWSVKKQMQLGQYAPPPAIKRRFPGFMFRGTGGVVGLDLVSLVCQGVADLVEEINTPWAATMGGLPVGAAGSMNDPSMWRAVQEGLPLAQKRFLEIRAAWPTVKIVIGKYSAGDVIGSLFEQWIKTNHPENYLCSFSFGPPTRPNGGGFFGQPAKWGNGVADMDLGDVNDPRGIWLVNEGDMYAQIPGGVVGDIMDDVFAEVTRFEFNDPRLFVERMVIAIPKIVSKAGISIPGAINALSGGVAGIMSFGLPLVLGAIAGLVPSNPAEYDKLTGPAAAACAAKLGLQFLFAGTGPHIRYHIDPAWPGGPTFLDLARMHVRDWCSRPGTIELLR